MISFRALISAALAGWLAAPAFANDPAPSPTPLPQPLGTPAPLTAPPAHDPCPPDPCVAPSGPRIRVIIPPPEIEYRPSAGVACDTGHKHSKLCGLFDRCRKGCMPFAGPQAAPQAGPPAAPQAAPQATPTATVVPYTYAIPYQTYVWAPVQTFSAMQTQAFAGVGGLQFGGAAFGGAGFGGLQMGGLQAGGIQLAAAPQSGGADVQAQLQLLQMLRLLQSEGQLKAAPSAGGCSGTKPAAGDSAVTLDQLAARIVELKTQLADLGIATGTAIEKHDKRIADLEAKVANIQANIQILKKVGDGTLTEIAKLRIEIEAIKNTPTVKKELPPPKVGEN